MNREMLKGQFYRSVLESSVLHFLVQSFLIGRIIDYKPPIKIPFAYVTRSIIPATKNGRQGYMGVYISDLAINSHV